MSGRLLCEIQNCNIPRFINQQGLQLLQNKITPMLTAHEHDTTFKTLWPTKKKIIIKNYFLQYNSKGNTEHRKRIEDYILIIVSL